MNGNFIKRTLVACGVLASLFLAPSAAGAAGGVLPENPTEQLKFQTVSWRYYALGKANSGAVVARGSKENTKRISRTILYTNTGDRRGLNVNIRKRIALRYELYDKGPKKGQVYRLYKPTLTTLEKTCRFYRIFRLTPHLSASLLNYGVLPSGEAVFTFEERMSFSLPRQFPMKRDSLTEFLRQLFHIEGKTQITTYRISPKGDCGTVSVSY